MPVRLLSRLGVTTAVMIAIAAPIAAHAAWSAGRPAPRASDAEEGAVAALVAFHAALGRGDSTAALALLSPDAVIVESGEVETRAQYRSHHLAEDIAFARGVPSHRSAHATSMQGDVAWLSSTSTSQGTFDGRAVNSAGAELAVLSRDGRDSTWRIRALHWSSRRRAR